jgi:hypothetical protein
VKRWELIARALKQRETGKRFGRKQAEMWTVIAGVY